MVRSPCSDLIGIRKGAWTDDEDQKLCVYIANHGEGAWHKLPQKAGLLRCGKSCRLRWTNYLKPGIKRGEFSPEEKQTIIRLYSSLGSKWSKIAKHLSGRTDNEIKNYWSTRLRRVVAQKGTHQSCVSFSPDQKKLEENGTLSGKSAPKFYESSKSPISTTSSKLLNNVASKFALSGSLASLVTKSISPQLSNKEIFSSTVGGDNSLMSTTSASDIFNEERISSSARLLNRMATKISPHLSLASTKAIASEQIPSVFDVRDSSGTCGDQSMNKVDQDEALFGQTSNGDGYNYYSNSIDEMVCELMGSNSLNDDMYYFGDFIDSTLI